MARGTNCRHQQSSARDVFFLYFADWLSCFYVHSALQDVVAVSHRGGGGGGGVFIASLLRWRFFSCLALLCVSFA